MRTRLTDTDPETVEVMDEIYSRMTPGEKLDRVRDVTLTAVRFALAGLRVRHPDEEERELLLRLARLRLGSAVVEEIYPSSPMDDGS